MAIFDLLQGIIFSGFLGLVMGNFATNPIYRLPLNEALFARDPYCGDCNTPLNPKDLFPVLSWLSTRGKCRYCGAGVPAAYTVTEALTGLLFILCYLKCGFSEPFILVSLGGTAIIMLGMMRYIDNFFSDKTWVAALVLGMLYRTLVDKTLFDFAGSAYFGIIAGVIAWKLSGKEMKRDAAAFPGYLKLLTLAGIWLTIPKLAIMCLITLVTALLLRQKIRWITEYVILAGILILLPF